MFSNVMVILGPGVTSTPSFSHVMVGAGTLFVWAQAKTTSPPTVAVLSVGSRAKVLAKTVKKSQMGGRVEAGREGEKTRGGRIGERERGRK